VNSIKKYFSRILYLLPRLLLISVFLIYVTFAFLSYFDYFEPYLYPLSFIRGKAYLASDMIIIGPYPHYEELKKLREDFGVTKVISLLNLNLPQEKALYEREKRDAERLAIETVSFPMEYLPLRSESNRQTLGKLIQSIRTHADARIYIHCYLGKHRTGFVAEGLRDAGFKPARKGGAAMKDSHK
jgi:hypothetical protein